MENRFLKCKANESLKNYVKSSRTCADLTSIILDVFVPFYNSKASAAKDISVSRFISFCWANAWHSNQPHVQLFNKESIDNLVTSSELSQQGCRSFRIKRVLVTWFSLPPAFWGVFFLFVCVFGFFKNKTKKSLDTNKSRGSKRLYSHKRQKIPNFIEL